MFNDTCQALLHVRFTGPKAGELKSAFCVWFARAKSSFYAFALLQGQTQKPTFFVQKDGVTFSFGNNFVLKSIFSDWLRTLDIQQSWEMFTRRSRLQVTNADSDYDGNRIFHS